MTCLGTLTRISCLPGTKQLVKKKMSWVRIVYLDCWTRRTNGTRTIDTNCYYLMMGFKNWN